MARIEVDTGLFEKLQQKVVVVTGGSSGIGLAVVKLLLTSGALVVNGDLQPPLDQDGQESSRLTFQKTDVSNWADLCVLFSKAKALHGHVDHVFANAGMGPQNTYMDLKLDDKGQPLEPSHQVLDVNLKGLINTAALAIHHIKTPKRDDVGSIVITGSASSYQRYVTTDYTISKHGALGVMRGIYPNLRAQDLPIRINTIMPSWTATGMVPQELMQAVGLAWQPAEVVANAVCLLMADGQRDGQALSICRGAIREVEEAILLKAACQIEDQEKLSATEDYMKLMEAGQKARIHGPSS